jgi:hypothetical protein
VRQTIGDVTFEVPDDLLTCGEYDYDRGDPATQVDPEMLKIDLANSDPGDAESFLVNARSTFQGLGGPFSSVSSTRFPLMSAARSVPTSRCNGPHAPLRGAV